MNDYNPSANDAFSPQQERGRSGSMMSLGYIPTNTQGPSSDNGGATVDDSMNKSQNPDGDSTSPTQPAGSSGANSGLKQVSDVLSSEIGIVTLLNRLKQSIASAKEFALFLKKRSSLEEDHANGIRKLTRTTQEVMRRPDHRQGTFGSAYEAMASTHERMAENGIEFSKELHQMHDELMELAGVAERSRKSWKQNGLSAENKVAEMEQTMRKSKAKYDSLADDYERVKTGESRQSGKMFGLKGHKSAQQHEGELLKKVQAADSTYHGHVQALQAEKAQLVSTTRPEAIRSLQDSIKEIDAGISLQMQKFASFNERLLLSNGLSVSPIQGPGAQSISFQRSLRQAASSIDNDKDLNDYVTAQHRSVPANTGEVEYKRNPVLNPPNTSGHVPGGPVQQPVIVQSPVSQTPPQGASLGPSPLARDQEPVLWDLVPSLVSLAILPSLLTTRAHSRSLITGASAKETCHCSRAAPAPALAPVPISKHLARDMATAVLLARLAHHSWVHSPSSRVVLLLSKLAPISLLMNVQAAVRTRAMDLRGLGDHRLLTGRLVIPRLLLGLLGLLDLRGQCSAYHSVVFMSGTV
ncbi:hypothetical protein NXS19_005388 [Fusarium pseudograminearum]|nr:hypothetical protein NXS19_005388 [Fusarium pseudograminearum]